MREFARLRSRLSVYQRRIQNFDLICRHDVDLGFAFAKFDCACDADDFPLDHGKSLIGRYWGTSSNEPGERLIDLRDTDTVDSCSSAVDPDLSPGPLERFCVADQPIETVEAESLLLGYSPPKLINVVPSGLVVTDTTRPRTSACLPTYLMASEALSLLVCPHMCHQRGE